MESKENNEDIQLFDENRKLGGYNVRVMDDWGFRIKKRHITESEKEQYERKFGHKMITDNEFFEWWKNLNSQTEGTTKH